MNKLFFSLFTLIIASCFLTVAAQSQFTGWTAVFATIKTGKKTSIHADAQIRSTDEIKQVQTLLFRTGLNYHLNKKMIATAGYAFILNKRIVSNVNGYAPEHRIWEQFIYNHRIKNIFTAHRFRLEQRLLPKTIVVNNELKTDGTLFASRFRYFIRNVIPFKKVTAFKQGPFAALQNEVFVNVGNTSNVNGKFFDQNRLYLAVGYRLHPKSDLEIGYMNQYVNGKGNLFANNHIVQLAGYLRL